MAESNSYWDAEDFLTSNQRIPCSFFTDIPGYGFLVRSSESVLPAKHLVELPLFLIEPLAASQFIELKEPVCFSAKVREDLDAEATCVNLHKLSPFYYAFGIRVVELTENEDLKEHLYKTFKNRLKSISDYTQTSKLIIDRFSFVNSLEASERRIYRDGYESEIATMNWMNQVTANMKN